MGIFESLFNSNKHSGSCIQSSDIGTAYKAQSDRLSSLVNSKQLIGLYVVEDLPDGNVFHRIKLVSDIYNSSNVPCVGLTFDRSVSNRLTFDRSVSNGIYGSVTVKSAKFYKEFNLSEYELIKFVTLDTVKELAVKHVTCLIDT